MIDRSHLLCLDPVGGGYCTLERGHRGARFEAQPCDHRSTYWRGEWVEACQACGGPLATLTTEDAEGRLICGRCCRDEADGRIDAMLAEIRAEAERRRRAELRRTRRV